MALTGFSRLLGKQSDQFIPLDAASNFTCGRPVYIDIDLARKFSIVDSISIDTIVHKLKQLGATAGGMSASSSLDNAMAHISVIGTIRVNYKIFQNTNEQGKKSGVYITDLDLNSFADGEPGLRKVNIRILDWFSGNSREIQPPGCLLNITSKYKLIQYFGYSLTIDCKYNLIQNFDCSYSLFMLPEIFLTVGETAELWSLKDIYYPEEPRSDACIPTREYCRLTNNDRPDCKFILMDS